MGIFNKVKKEKDNKSTGKKSSMKDLYEDKDKQKSEKSKESSVKAVATAKTDKTDAKLGNAYQILVRPLITEKAANLGSEDKYVFAVNKNANKIEIAKAINEVYGIKPIAVNIVRVGGKKVRHGRVQGRRKDWKKAIVTLPKGKTINIYEGV